MTLFAQSPGIVHTKEKSAIQVLPQESPQGLKTIYSNLKSEPDLYNDADGWAITRAESVGVPFTPKSYSHVLQVRVPVKYLAGANQVNVSIYGAPVTFRSYCWRGRWRLQIYRLSVRAVPLPSLAFRLPSGPELGTGWWSPLLLAEPAAISRAFGTRLPRSFR